MYCTTRNIIGKSYNKIISKQPSYKCKLKNFDNININDIILTNGSLYRIFKKTIVTHKYADKIMKIYRFDNLENILIGERIDSLKEDKPVPIDCCECLKIERKNTKEFTSPCSGFLVLDQEFLNKDTDINNHKFFHIPTIKIGDIIRNKVVDQVEYYEVESYDTVATDFGITYEAFNYIGKKINPKNNFKKIDNIDNNDNVILGIGDIDKNGIRRCFINALTNNSYVVIEKYF